MKENELDRCERENTYTLCLPQNLRRTDHSKGIGINNHKIKMDLENMGWDMCSEFIQFYIGSNCGVLSTC
jgi:hypothetical protein